MKEIKNKDNNNDVLANIKWFSKFSLEKRFKIAFEQIKAIKTLRSLKLKKQ